MTVKDASQTIPICIHRATRLCPFTKWVFRVFSTADSLYRWKDRTTSSGFNARIHFSMNLIPLRSVLILTSVGLAPDWHWNVDLLSDWNETGYPAPLAKNRNSNCSIKQTYRVYSGNTGKYIALAIAKLVHVFKDNIDPETMIISKNF